MEDEQIIQLYNLRNEEAISETEKKYGALCRRTVRRILGDEREIEECVSDVLLQLWNSIPPEQPDSLPAFLVTVTRNIACNRWRCNSRQKRGGGQIALVLEELSACIHDSEDMDEMIDERLFVQMLERFLDQLSDDARKIFVQRYIIMLSVKEIAVQYHMSESKVKVTLLRTRKRLRKYMKQEGWL